MSDPYFYCTLQQVIITWGAGDNECVIILAQWRCDLTLWDEENGLFDWCKPANSSANLLKSKDQHVTFEITYIVFLFSNLLDLPLSLSDTFCQAKDCLCLKQIWINLVGFGRGDLFNGCYSFHKGRFLDFFDVHLKRHLKSVFLSIISFFRNLTTPT